MRRNSSRIFRGNKGALRVPLLSFQYLRRPRCAAKLLCYHIVSEFESHRLHQNQAAQRASLKTLSKRILVASVSLVALAYFGDYLSVRIRMMHLKPADPFESLKGLRVLAIPEKNGKTEYEVDAQNPEQTVTCVHSLFPHFGYSPCWYVKPRISQPIPM